MSHKHTREKREIDIERVAMVCDGCRKAEIEIQDEWARWSPDFIGWSTLTTFRSSNNPLAPEGTVEAGIENARHFCPTCTKQRFE